MPAAASKRPRRGSGRVTLAEVAAVAGVSAQTVSRVLNGPQNVPAATVDRVRAAIAQVGYVPNRMAGGLASGRSKLVAALVPALASPVFQETIESLIRSLAANGYQLMLGESGYDDVDEVQLLENLISRGPDGIVLTRVLQSGLARERLASSGIPVVETWDLTPDPVDMLVGFSHEQVGAGVADLMIAHGIRQPALVTGNDPRARRRRQGYARRFVERGCLASVSDLPVAEVEAPAPLGSGRRALARLIDSGRAFDGVFCSTDMLALGVLMEAGARKLEVPGRLGVVGFGDLVFAADTTPALTTVRIDGRRMGQLAAQLIMQRAQGQAVAEPVHDIGFELVLRDSL
ncbi:LacI family DNA-binding transcriptional regulator [Comamonas endophytica]|uniref:LacI family DNA-binding transcriptional regulator n=1 Tax=Comamonas endophytica TaxID=2949090 RepID=A0ABY6GBB8_9BURK|nr:MULTISPECIES: LacI family DNA-binding transcriptional regulator [unclassified Acidovorax]MCD2513644.1 LacI family DNA-binding transcriptional regulator [Acidovorax sp. D4N7]UYG52348.1 LacI family DNA-binding transcriptional regulator [Acidovorax sp. 5MLIR]